MGWTQDALEFHRTHHISIGQPIRPEEIVGAWLRECGKTKQDALVQLAQCQQDVERMKLARQQEVQFRQELASMLALPHPAPQKILEAVRKVLGSHA